MRVNPANIENHFSCGMHTESSDDVLSCGRHVLCVGKWLSRSYWYVATTYQHVVDTWALVCGHHVSQDVVDTWLSLFQADCICVEQPVEKNIWDKKNLTQFNFWFLKQGRPEFG